MKVKLHLTDNYQLQQADKLISQLKIQLGQEREYIEELEEGVYSKLEDKIRGEYEVSLVKNINSLQKELSKWKKNYEKLLQQNNKYRVKAEKFDLLTKEILEGRKLRNLTEQLRIKEEQLLNRNEMIKALKYRLSQYESID